ncbi:MAG: site-specific integrase [Crocinitomicaceae bacterium]
MSNSKPLIIDKKQKVSGLYTYCGKCKRLIENRQCSETGKRLSTCKNTEQHGFKAIISVPGTDSKKRKTRIFNTRDLNEAIRLKLEFEEELQANDYQSTNIHMGEAITKPDLLIDCMAMYLGYLNNEDVETHMVKVRTKKHIWEVENYFEKFCKALKKNGIDHTLFRMNQVNDKTVALFHSFILDDLKHANKTYNKMIALFRQFIDWLNSKKGYELVNPFTVVQRRKENINKTIISLDEFKELLKVINPENGYQIYPSGERKNRYRDWLANSFKLALETGLRREEFMTLKFSDIINDEHGQPILIEVDNFKVNRIKGGDQLHGQKKYVPITKGLIDLLKDLGFDQFKTTDKYLLANEEKSSRDTLIDFVSKAFTHFWKHTGIAKNVQLKHLRKTYLTSLVEHFGDKAPVISNHSGIDVLMKHYVNDQHLVAATKGFSVFKNAS